MVPQHLIAYLEIKFLSSPLPLRGIPLSKFFVAVRDGGEDEGEGEIISTLTCRLAASRIL